MELPPSLRFFYLDLCIPNISLSGTVLIDFNVAFVLQVAEARRALPCWDEPAHKATYDIALVVPKDRVALSNMVSATC